MDMFKSAYKDLKHVALGVSPLEAKVLEQTSNEPWGPHGTVLGELASYTRDSQDTTIIFTILRRRMMDEGKDWRHVYKSLSVIEFMIGHGSEGALREAKSMIHELRALESFLYVQPDGKDQGLNVRHKSAALIALISDNQAIAAVRAKAQSTRGKYNGISSMEARGGGGGGQGFNSYAASEPKYSGYSSDDYKSSSRFDAPATPQQRKDISISSQNNSHVASTTSSASQEGAAWEAFGDDEFDPRGASRGVPKVVVNSPSKPLGSAATAPKLSAPSAPQPAASRTAPRLAVPLPARAPPAPPAPSPAPAPAPAPGAWDDAFDPRENASFTASRTSADAFSRGKAAAPPVDDLFGSMASAPAPAGTSGLDQLLGGFPLAPTPASQQVDPFGPLQGGVGAAVAPNGGDMFGDFVAIATPVAMPTHAQHPHLAPAFSTPNLSTSAINNGNAASPDFFAAQPTLDVHPDHSVHKTNSTPQLGMSSQPAVSITKNPSAARKAVMSGGLGDMAGLVDLGGLSLSGSSSKTGSTSSMGMAMGMNKGSSWL